MNLDRAGIFQLALNPFDDVAGDQRHLVIRDLIGLYDDADLAAGLDSIAFFYAGEGRSDLFEFFKTLDVVFEVFSSCAGTCGGNSVRCLNEGGNNRFGLNVSVMRFNGVEDRGAFFVLAADINADLDMGAFDLMVERLADVVQQTCAFSKP